MKRTYILFTLLASISSNALAYEYKVTNNTDNQITVSIDPTALIGSPKSVSIQPGKTSTIDYTGFAIGLCLNYDSIKVNGEKVDLINPEKPTTGETVAAVASGSASIFCGNKDITIEKEGNTIVAASSDWL